MEIEFAKDAWITHDRYATRKIDSLQAKIDELMLEFCPDKMTEEQIANWKRHQQVLPVNEMTWIESKFAKRNSNES